jgi:hypothetical protein
MSRQFRALNWTMFIGDDAGLMLVPDASMTAEGAAAAEGDAASWFMPGMLLISCCAASGHAASSIAEWKRIRLDLLCSLSQSAQGCERIRYAGLRSEAVERNR